jgi:hypothetical protein
MNRGLTSRFLLRMHPHERILADQVVRDHADFDIIIGLNDAFRYLIRRGAADPPSTVEDARSLIMVHFKHCDRCDDQRIGCPGGKWLKDAYDRLAAAAARPPAARRPRLLPPPPGMGTKVKASNVKSPEPN